MQHKSKLVTSNQLGIHDDLELIMKRYQDRPYLRPIADYSKQTFDEISRFVFSHGNAELVLDMGCGTGRSSYELAQRYPDKLVLGIDKSISRIERQNHFKRNPMSNVLLVRGELLDLWYLFYLARDEFSIFKQYILYPNPWPKKKLVKKRFHANPIFPFLLQLSNKLELRTNWKIYAEEFQFSCELLGNTAQLSELNIEKPISAFEEKYLLSGHQFFKVELVG